MKSPFLFLLKQFLALNLFRISPKFLAYPMGVITLAGFLTSGSTLLPTLAPAQSIQSGKAKRNNQPQQRGSEFTNANKPNIILVLADDLGYGDLGCYGNPLIKTPVLDKMASGGIKFTQFYSPAPVCTPSRAGIMLGQLPQRSGLSCEKRGVLFPNTGGGLPDSLITLPEMLTQNGYTTGMVGKWHLGHLPKHLPLNHGFQYYYGIPYSNDMYPQNKYPPLPIIENFEQIDTINNQEYLTEKYTQKAIAFITKNKQKPFFLYFAHHAPHIPLYPHPDFKGKSKRGAYGDVVEEIDFRMGQLLNTLKELGIAKNTLIIFTSDNGPWKIKKQEGGSAGPLRGDKGSVWEGGMRVPAIIYGPEVLKPIQQTGNSSSELASGLDLMATLAELTGSRLPATAEDGYSLLPIIKGKPAERKEILYYYKNYYAAYRLGPNKVMMMTNGKANRHVFENLPQPETYNLETDISEEYPQAAKEDLLNQALQRAKTITFGKDQSAIPVK